MGTVVPRSAGSDTIIEDHFNKTIENANARGGDIQQATEARLGALAEPIDSNSAQHADATKMLDSIDSILLARDGESDLEVGAVCDEIWNALGRPAQSPDYAMIAGNGVAQWTGGDPAKQHNKMRILASNIRLATHPALQARKEEWALRIEERAKAQEEAAKPLDAAEALVEALSQQRRTLANQAQVALTRLKRDLKNLGLTEPQIHDIIPTYSPKPRKAKEAAPTSAETPLEA